MKGIMSYMKNAYEELLHNVTWPSWADLQNSALVVLIASIIIALLIWVMDFVSKNGMIEVYKLLVG